MSDASHICICEYIHIVVFKNRRHLVCAMHGIVAALVWGPAFASVELLENQMCVCVDIMLTCGFVLVPTGCMLWGDSGEDGMKHLKTQERVLGNEMIQETTMYCVNAFVYEESLRV